MSCKLRNHLIFYSLLNHPWKAGAFNLLARAYWALKKSWKLFFNEMIVIIDAHYAKCWWRLIWILPCNLSNLLAYFEMVRIHFATSFRFLWKWTLNRVQKTRFSILKARKFQFCKSTPDSRDRFHFYQRTTTGRLTFQTLEKSVTFWLCRKNMNYMMFDSAIGSPGSSGNSGGKLRR